MSGKVGSRWLKKPKNLDFTQLLSTVIVISNKNGKLFLHQTRVIARNTCLNLNLNDYSLLRITLGCVRLVYNKALAASTYSSFHVGRPQ